MKIELLHVVNGYRKFHLGFYDSGQEAVEAMKRDVLSIRRFMSLDSVNQ